MRSGLVEAKEFPKFPNLQIYMAKRDSRDVANALLPDLWNIAIFSPTIPAEEGLREIGGV